MKVFIVATRGIPVKIMFKKFLLKVFCILLIPFILLKWILEFIKIPLDKRHFFLYLRIHCYSYRVHKRFPDLVRPKTLNDKIQWLKIFDQSPQIVQCTDKIAVRDYVENVVGNKYLTKIYWAGKVFNKDVLRVMPTSFVLKSNNDSGTVVIVRDKAAVKVSDLVSKTNQALFGKFGWDAGEWAYRYIQPSLFTEELISSESEFLPSDYKFHCVDGKVKFCRVISERGAGTKEVVVSPSGKIFNFTINENLIKRYEFEVPVKWGEMILVAEKLSREFKFVRIDLYCVEDQIYFGEMTFFPGAGFYSGKGQVYAGEYVDFDLSSVKDPVVYK